MSSAKRKKSDSLKARMREIVRDAMLEIIGEDEFWGVLDEVMGDDAEYDAWLSFSSGKPAVVVGNKHGDWTIELPFELERSDNNYVGDSPFEGGQADAVAAEVDAIDELMSRLNSKRAELTSALDNVRKLPKSA